MEKSEIRSRLQSSVLVGGLLPQERRVPFFLMPSGLGAVVVVAAPASPMVVVALMVHEVGEQDAQEIELFGLSDLRRSSRICKGVAVLVQMRDASSQSKRKSGKDNRCSG